jgi:stage II sporulation protein D
MRRLLGVLAVSAALVASSIASAGTTFVVDGQGWGHGVGMSQYGAYGFALQGWSHERILAHFYRETQLGALPNRSVRVLVAEAQGRLTVGSAKPFRRRLPETKRATLKAGSRSLTPRNVRSLGGLVSYAPGASPLRVAGKAYRGSIEVYLERGKLFAVNEVSLDHYLRGVVPREMPFFWPQEALRAQAIVARSYTLATLQPGDRFDLYADVRDQVYDGIEAERDPTNRAVAATAGRIVTWSGRVATTYYHSTSGGRTANVVDVWPNAIQVPYLVSVSDPYDHLSKHHRWQPAVFTPGQLAKRLRVSGLKDVIVERNASGRAGTVRVVRAAGERRFVAEDVRDLLDLRSTFFDVRVLALEPKLRRIRAGRPLELTGFARGLTGIRLERAVAGGTWESVRPLRLAPTGRFRTVVRPDEPTRYRIANHVAAGLPVSVQTRP